MKKQRSNKGYALIEGWTSLVLNVLLFILKYWAGIVTGSVALIADAWHTLSDSFTSIVVLFGAKISSKPADKEHPYGHGRAELIAAIVIGVLLSVVGFSFLLESIERLGKHDSVVFGKIAIWATIVSVLSKEAMAQYAFYTSKKTGSRSLKADAWHHRTDALSSLIILIGIFLGKHFWWMDGLLGLIVSALIFYTTYDILSEVISPLLGEKPEDELADKIKKLIDDAAPYNIYPHHLLLHEYGNHKEITFHVKLPPDMSIYEAHEIVTRIEKKLKKDMNISSTIHMEPKTGRYAPPLLPDPAKPE